jgi:MFS family permease
VVDELASGVAPTTVPELARDLGLEPGYAAGVVLVAFHAFTLFVDAPLLAYCERFAVGRVSSLALATMAAACGLAAVAPNVWLLGIGLAVYGSACGLALAAAEGTLVESHPNSRAKMTARIGLAGTLGDLSVPVLVGALGLLGLGWRTGMGVAGAAALLLSVVHARQPSLSVRFGQVAGGEDDPPAPLRESLRVAFSTRPLIAWALAAAATTLLDEVLVAFAAIRLAAVGAPAAVRSGALAVEIVGSLAGLAVLERLADRERSSSLAIAASLGCGASLVAFASVSSPGVAIAALAVVGFTGAPLHPIAKSRAYAALPGRPAIVSAVESAFSIVDLLAPMALGALVVHFGSGVAIVALTLAPLIVAITALWRARP